MSSNKKVLLVATLMLLGLAAATIINIAINFRSYAFQSAEDKARLTASIVRDGLTAHMINGIMDKRLDFLKNVANKHTVEELWIVRAPKVVELFGDGFKNEHERDEIDHKVITEGTTERLLEENSKQATIRITIPYKASAYGSPNCLKCHTNAKEGDVLGAISMKFNIGDVRSVGVLTILKIFGINLLFILITLYIINKYTKPYISLFDQLKRGLKKAHHGNFNTRIQGDMPEEAAEITNSFNALFDKMDDTFGEVKNSLSSFVTQVECSEYDPLHEANLIIHELADVYRFKKTIELDKEKHNIYKRIIHLLESKFDINHFAFYEVNHIQKRRTLLHISEGDSFCSELSLNNANECRAFRTQSDVYSEDFPHLCEACENQHIHYICLPYQINDKSSLVFSFSTYKKDEYHRISERISSIKNYLDAAKPVIESKIFMEILKDSSLKDGLTGLYNRRFLEEFIDKLTSQSKRKEQRYAILMVDIDYFKMVNDTYGHDVGDVVIKKLSDILQSSIREADLAIRFGGEEFLILLHEADANGAVMVAQKIRKSFADVSFEVENEVMKKTLSIGVALYPDDADSIWKVIKFADTALYKAKHNGRNQVVAFQAKDFDGEQY